MIHNFTHIRKILCFALVIMAIIPLYKSVVFGNESLDTLKILKESLVSPIQEITYKTDRFDVELEKAQSQRDKNNFEESNQIAINYFDKAFADGCPSLGLISKNHISLGNQELSIAYKDAERFCELIRLPELESEMSEIHKGIKKSTILYPDELVFSVFDLYFRSVLNGEELLEDNRFSESLSHKFIQTVIKTKGSEYENYTFDNFSDILDVDFVPKPSILVTLGSRYNQEDILKQVLEYEDIVKNRGQFRSVYHNVYHSLAPLTSISDNDKMYYYLSSLEFDSSRTSQYEGRIILLFYKLELFKDKKNIDAFSKIFPELDSTFFDTLELLASGSEQEFIDISATLAAYGSDDKYQAIKKKDLLQYLYTFIVEKEASEICSSLSQMKILDSFSTSVDSFIICETQKETKKAIDEIMEITEVENKDKTDTNVKKSPSPLNKINLPTKQNFIFILSLIIFIAIISFIAFIFLKKK